MIHGETRQRAARSEIRHIGRTNSLGYDCIVPSDQESLIDAIALSPIAMVVTNPRVPDNPLEFVNDAFCRLTGYAEAEIIGRNCRFLSGEDTEAAAKAELRAAITEARPTLNELVNYRRDGSAFRNGVMI